MRLKIVLSFDTTGCFRDDARPWLCSRTCCRRDAIHSKLLLPLCIMQANNKQFVYITCLLMYLFTNVFVLACDKLLADKTANTVCLVLAAANYFFRKSSIKTVLSFINTS